MVVGHNSSADHHGTHLSLRVASLVTRNEFSYNIEAIVAYWKGVKKLDGKQAWR